MRGRLTHLLSYVADFGLLPFLAAKRDFIYSDLTGLCPTGLTEQDVDNIKFATIHKQLCFAKCLTRNCILAS